jgi:hypothetical protein
MNRRRLLFCTTALLLLGSAVCIGACQARQRVQLSDGLVKQSDLAGQWQWSDGKFVLVAPDYSGYKNIPAIETAERLLDGDYYSSDKHYVNIFHLLLRCEDSCPSSEALKPIHDTNLARLEKFALNLQNTGQSTDTQCLKDIGTSPPVTACAVEVRYAHILSRLTFYINGEISKEEIEHIFNEMLLQVDKRLQEIDLYFGEKAS